MSVKLEAALPAYMKKRTRDMCSNAVTFQASIYGPVHKKRLKEAPMSLGVITKHGVLKSLRG
jgi:hypothetical protein